MLRNAHDRIAHPPSRRNAEPLVADYWPGLGDRTIQKITEARKKSIENALLKVLVLGMGCMKGIDLLELQEQSGLHFWPSS
jgi:hypothetical protein